MRLERRRQLAYEVARLTRKGLSQRAIATKLGVARRTVKRLLDELAARRAQGETVVERELPVRAPKPSKLDAYEGLLRQWLETWPNIKANRCLEKLREETDFDGSYTIVRERVKQLRAEIAPSVPAQPFVTAPGQRAEFDWSPYQLVNDKIQLWNVRLRWSRASHLAGEPNSKQTTILRNLRAAFDEWGGVPRECLTDSMPGVVDRWELDRPIVNARFVDFAAHYGFEVHIAPRRCPQWKAIAERLFRYHEDNLLNGRTIADLCEYRELLAWWRRERAMARGHPETGQPIAEMLERERAHLQPLPAHPYDTRDVVVRVVDDYQRVRLDTNHYPVPAPVGARVYVCADVDRIEICDPRARRLIEHERLATGAGIVLDPLPGAARRADRYDLDQLVERVGEWGEVAATYARELRAARRRPGPDLVRLLQLQVHWRLDDLVAAMEYASRFGSYQLGQLERILDRRFSPRHYEELIADRCRESVRRLMEDQPVTQRSLSAYQTLADGDQRADDDD